MGKANHSHIPHARASLSFPNMYDFFTIPSTYPIWGNVAQYFYQYMYILVGYDGNGDTSDISS